VYTFKNKTSKNKTSSLARATAGVVASIWALQSGAALASNVNTAGPVVQGTSNGSSNYALNNPPSVISFAGQTALKNFNLSGALTELEPGTSITLHNGTNGAATIYSAPADTTGNSNGVGVQLASNNFSTADSWYDANGDPEPVGNTVPEDNVIQNNSALLVQWHAEGSIDGFYDLINDEIGYAGGYSGTSISQASLRGPTAANPTYYNTVSFTAPGSSKGFAVSSVSDLNNTYDSSVDNQSTGANLAGGQNRVQFSVGEYPTEALAVTGTGTGGTGGASPFATPGSAGYGLGNTALQGQPVLTALGVGNSRQQFQNTSIANEATTTQNPTSPTATANVNNTYVAGPWNTAGASNITSIPFAVTAVTYSSNPGTGLTHLDLSDTQWLQTTGRLQNGGLFNVVARTVDTGQRAVFALNTGIDPSWAVGSNDDGNSTTTVQANAEHSIGPAYRVDGKTSGSEAEIAIAQGRMSLGALSVPEANGNTAAAPVNALAIDFDANSTYSSTNYVSANFQSIISSGTGDTNPNAGGSAHYAAVLISHYNTVKAASPTALFAEEKALGYVSNSDTNVADATNTSVVSATNQQAAWAQVQSFNPNNRADPTTSGIQGDPTGDVASVLSNVINSGGTAATKGLTVSQVDPADGLFATGYLIPQLLDYTRTTDGGAITPVTLSANALSEQSQVQNPSNGFVNLFKAPSGNTTGSGAYYADQNTVQAANGSFPAVNPYNGATGAVPIDSINYLFGNFNQNGVRDYSAVTQAVNAALSLYAVDSASGGVNSIYSGAPNSTVIPSLDNSAGTPGWAAAGATKGDLIVLGDYNSDGSFDGKDLYLLATGASLADSTSSNTLTVSGSTPFADAVRNPNAVLRKNAALNYINNYLNTTTDTAGAAFLRKTGAAILAGSSVPSGATDLHSVDPITGLEQFSYDPTGTNAFNPLDIDRAGLVDFNDAILVDEYQGESYTNLTQSLAATEQAPVTGAIEPLSLVAVQLVDGEAAIGPADLAAINAGLTGTGNANWYGYALNKTGAGTITWARTGGTVTVYAGAQFNISGGTVQVGGTVDPFSDNNAVGTTTTVGNHLAVAVNNGAKLQFIQNARTSTVASLSVNLASGSQVDIGNNKLLIDYGANPTPAASIISYLASGYNGGAWNGPGIASSTIVTGYGIGFADGADRVATGLSSGQIEVKETLYGDINLDGEVNGTDFGILAAHFGQNVTGGWEEGDFTYAGKVSGTDFGLLASNFGKSATGVAVSLPASDWAALDSFAAANGLLADVPEPTGVGFLGVAAGATLIRRRRARRNIVG
jgi:hypothetical protein